jgi:hypothetical protein
MVMQNNFGQNISRKVDLRLAQREGTLLKLYSHRVHHDLMRHRLSAMTGAMDNLLERLIELGFDLENLEAIRLAPIAEVAWASGSVTQLEPVFAVSAVLSSDMLNAPIAFELFQLWLAKRPDRALWSLWEDYTTDGLARSQHAQEEEFGKRLHQVASRVALASGGLLNQGDICGTEQRALDRIARVYRLNPEHS